MNLSPSLLCSSISVVLRLCFAQGRIGGGLLGCGCWLRWVGLCFGHRVGFVFIPVGGTSSHGGRVVLQPWVPAVKYKRQIYC